MDKTISINQIKKLRAALKKRYQSCSLWVRDSDPNDLFETIAVSGDGTFAGNNSSSYMIEFTTGRTHSQYRLKEEHTYQYIFSLILFFVILVSNLPWEWKWIPLLVPLYMAYSKIKNVKKLREELEQEIGKVARE